MKRSCQLSASLICGDPLNTASDLEELEMAGIDFLHFDVMDGLFVPRLGLYPELLKSIKRASKIPVDVHLMINDPLKYIPNFIEAGADLITVHAEAAGNLPEIIQFIKSQGKRAGVALRPDTPLQVLDPVENDIDLILLMAIHPGILGQKLIPSTMEKIAQTREKFKDRPEILIEIDGGVTPVSAPEMIKLGANVLVCGTGTIYRPHEGTLSQKIGELKEILK